MWWCDISLFDYDFATLISSGVIGSIIGQYISDLFFNIFIYDRKEFLDIITNISPIPAYIASTAAGFANGITEPYIDDITSVGMRNVVYAYTNDYFSNQLNEEDLVSTLSMPELVQDTIAVIIIVWVFNSHARHDFYNHKADLYHQPHPFHDEQDIFTSIIIVVVINLYAYYRLQRDNRLISSGLDQTIDLAE